MRRRQQSDLAIPIAIITAAVILVLGPLLIFLVMYVIFRVEHKQQQAEFNRGIQQIVRDAEQAAPQPVSRPDPPPRRTTALRMAATACRRRNATLDTQTAIAENDQTTWYVSGAAKTDRDGRTVPVTIEMEHLADARQWRLIEIRLDNQYVD